MSAAAVHEIVDRIKQLHEEDRRLLDELLTKLEEEEWRDEVSRARQNARERSIGQEEIDRAVHRVRYGI